MSLRGFLLSGSVCPPSPWFSAQGQPGSEHLSCAPPHAPPTALQDRLLLIGISFVSCCVVLPRPLQSWEHHHTRLPIFKLKICSLAQSHTAAPPTECEPRGHQSGTLHLWKGLACAALSAPCILLRFTAHSWPVCLSCFLRLLFIYSLDFQRGLCCARPRRRRKAPRPTFKHTGWETSLFPCQLSPLRQPEALSRGRSGFRFSCTPPYGDLFDLSSET